MNKRLKWLFALSKKSVHKAIGLLRIRNGISFCVVLGSLVLLHACTSSSRIQPAPFVTSQSIPNGGFEAYDYLWWQPPQQYAGELDPAESRGGLHAWRMDLASYAYPVVTAITAPRPSSDSLYLALWIRTAAVTPQNAVSVRIQPSVAGEPARFLSLFGNRDLLFTGGTHTWKRFVVELGSHLPPDADRLTIYLRAHSGATGTVWFDDLSLITQRPAQNQQPEPTTIAPRPPLPPKPSEAVAFFQEKAPIALATASASNVFYRNDNIRITIAPDARQVPPESKLNWRISDYFGNTVLEDKGPARITTITVPTNASGYLEVEASLLSKQGTPSSARHSLVRFPYLRPPQPDSSYVFGSWVQQDDMLPHLGVRWTRVGSGWRYLEPQPNTWNPNLQQQELSQIRHFHAQGIRLIYLFGKVPPWAGPDAKRYAPEHEAAFRNYVRQTVERYKDWVDVWETMNEPYMPDLYKGTLEEIIRWHQIVYEEVKRADPDATVIGLGLSPRVPTLFRQMDDLLQRGIGRYFDAVALHTYGGLEAAGFTADLEATQALLNQHGLPHTQIYITEHGLSAPSSLAMERLQAQHLVRSLFESQAAGVQAFIWHMMSWPQGPTDRERNFAIVRTQPHSPNRMPRPAFAAAGIAAHMLGKAAFKKTFPNLPLTTKVYNYSSDTSSTTVIWDWGQKRTPLRLETDADELIVVNIMGNRSTYATQNGAIVLTATPDPLYVLGHITNIEISDIAGLNRQRKK